MNYDVAYVIYLRAPSSISLGVKFYFLFHYFSERLMHRVKINSETDWKLDSTHEKTLFFFEIPDLSWHCATLYYKDGKNWDDVPIFLLL